VFFLISADINALCDPQWRKLNMNILVLFKTSVITLDKMQNASGAQPSGEGDAALQPNKL
jgi:hypothetical protein